MNKERIGVRYLVLGLVIITAGVMADYVFGRIDTMAGLLLIAAVVLWRSGK